MQAQPDWSEVVVGEAGIQRARSFAASAWYRDTDEDVFMMLDDDITFEPEDAVRLVERCRSGDYDIIGAGYPFRDGSHIAVRTFPGDTRLGFGPDVPPHEVRHVATGFLAVHRRVLAAMVPTLPLCNSLTPGAFWPFFDFSIIEDPEAGGYSYLSEDYTFGERARALGFKVWLDRSIFLGHMGEVQLTVHNMAAIKAALTSG